MIIPNQLPQIVTAARSGALQALALKAGQVLDGRVIGPAPNGGTQVQLQGQLLNLVLPQAAKAGETLRFEVQGSGAQVRLALQVAAGKLPVPAPTSTPPLQTTATPPGNSAANNATGNSAAPPSVSATPPASAAPLPPATVPQTAPTTAATPNANAAPQPNAVGAPPTSTAATTAVPSATAGGQPSPPAAASVAQTATTPANALASGAVAVSPAATTAPRQASPYAPSVPTNPNAATAASTGATKAAIQASPGPSAIAPTPAANVGSAVAPGLPSIPQAALAQMVQAALPQQNSIANLTAALTSIAGNVALPEPVARAVQQVLANQVNLDGGKLSGGALQKAVMNSGVFQEASLARPGAPLLPPQADMKAAMMALRQTLTTWLGQQTPLISPVAQIAPPLRGQFPRVRSLEVPPVDPATSADDVGKHLLDRTESALSRVRLHQHASLPDPTIKGADWSTDLPVVIAGQQTLLQLQIHRDDHNASDEAGERGWQMRFAINLPGMGEVGAQVSLRGGATGVMLWAEEATTSMALAAEVDVLRHTLVEAGLEPGAVIVRHGAPPPPAKPASSGHIVDSRR